jgi:hypothetical protein
MIDDPSNEADLIKAGFSKSEAQDMASALKDPNGIYASLGSQLEAARLAALSSGGGLKKSTNKGQASSNLVKDEYKPIISEERVPASAEGLLTNYHGEMIGVDGDDLFKMMNRRYKMKLIQNFFLD